MYSQARASLHVCWVLCRPLQPQVRDFDEHSFSYNPIHILLLFCVPDILSCSWRGHGPGLSTARIWTLSTSILRSENDKLLKEPVTEITILFAGWVRVSLLADEVHLPPPHSDDWDGHFMGSGKYNSFMTSELCEETWIVQWVQNIQLCSTQWRGTMVIHSLTEW